MTEKKVKNEDTSKEMNRHQSLERGKWKKVAILKFTYVPLPLPHNRLEAICSTHNAEG